MKNDYTEGQKTTLQWQKIFQNSLQQNKLWMIVNMMLCRTYFSPKNTQDTFLIWQLIGEIQSTSM